MRSIAISLVLGYQLIPKRIRRFWSADSSSGSALAALRDGAPIGSTLSRYAVPHFHGVWEPPSWNN